MTNQNIKKKGSLKSVLLDCQCPHALYQHWFRYEGDIFHCPKLNSLSPPPVAPTTPKLSLGWLKDNILQNFILGRDNANVVYHTMNKYGKGKVYLHAFLTLALDESGKSASCLSYFSLEKRSSYFHWIGRRISPRSDPDTMKTWKISSLWLELNLNSSII